LGTAALLPDFINILLKKKKLLVQDQHAQQHTQQQQQQQQQQPTAAITTHTHSLFLSLSRDDQPLINSLAFFL